jgi:hypothetical protein
VEYAYRLSLSNKTIDGLGSFSMPDIKVFDQFLVELRQEHETSITKSPSKKRRLESIHV